jgi:hypothetical protein
MAAQSISPYAGMYNPRGKFTSCASNASLQLAHDSCKRAEQLQSSFWAAVLNLAKKKEKVNPQSQPPSQLPPHRHVSLGPGTSKGTSSVSMEAPMGNAWKGVWRHMLQHGVMGVGGHV